MRKKTPPSSSSIPRPTGAVKLFTNDREALFVRRPNRFLIIAKDGEEELACHCPNPGRLMEMLFPGTRLILEKRRGFPAEKPELREKPAKAAETARGEGPKTRKTDYLAAAVYYRNRPAPLFSSRANNAARLLILEKIIPGLMTIRPEYAIGSSRFDFLCTDAAGERHLVEVKACSLIEHETAMFPDAPSVRALKHLEELAALTAEGYRCHILFVIVHGNPGRFIPNLHTDPLFAAALSRYGMAAEAPPLGAGETDRCRAGTHPVGAAAEAPPLYAAAEGPAKPVSIHAALIRCGRTGKAVLSAASVPVDLSHGELAGSNRGNYLILLELTEKADVTVGALGTVAFAPGWYVYAGSAQKNLSRRISRHLRKIRKQKHWHIDYLTPWAETLQALPILAYRNLECDLAEELRKLGGKPVIHFGSSDCDCKKFYQNHSHLYYFKDPPMTNRAFVDMLLRYRHREAFLR